MSTSPSPPVSGGPLSLDGGSLTIDQVHQVARLRQRVELSPAARSLLERSQETLRTVLEDGAAIYGVNTGFGALASQRVGGDQLEALQINLLRSHASGVGEPLPEEVVRSMMLLLAASLCRGRSGVQVALVENLVAFLNADVTPVVPETGSVGASGDLAPLAHLALPLLGEGEATSDGKRLDGAEALRRAGATPLRLGPKEGLALINGTHLMAGRAALALKDMKRVFDAALVGAAMSLDANKTTDSFLDPRVHAARMQSGQIEVARRLGELLEGSEIIPSHAEDDPRVQDPYSFRCAPVVLGAALDLMNAVWRVVELELGAVTDNPLVFENELAGRRVVSAGNFHGMPLALHMDALTPAIAQVAGIAERRVFHMLAARDRIADLSPQLSPDPGLQSGFMVAQYAAAACCNELATLSTPACVTNIPTCAGMEDYNSSGPRSVAKAARGVQLTRSVVAIELLCAAEALERARPLRSGAAVERAHAIIREHVAELERDRSPAPDIASIERLIRDGAFSESCDDA